MGAILTIIAGVGIKKATGKHHGKYDKREASAGVPAFVLDYAPKLYLHSDDPYRPADIATHLSNTMPNLGFEPISDASSPFSLDNLDALNAFATDDAKVFLTTSESAVPGATFLHGTHPDDTGLTADATISIFIVNYRGDDVVDAFYFYFYSFDYGGNYAGWNVGNHVGDWEHNMIRFKDGKPSDVWFSQHANGQAFAFEGLEKEGQRPVVYVANGTHANYAVDGDHGYAVPNHNTDSGLIEDHTDRGVFWDPVLSAWFYSFDASEETFEPFCSSTPVNWLKFKGHWGDKQYPESDPRQEKYFPVFDIFKYSSGPTGPIDKDLDRDKLCPGNGNECIVWPETKP